MIRVVRGPSWPRIAPVVRILTFAGVAALGWATGAGLDLRVAESGGVYAHVVTGLLAVGLVASVQGIDLADARRHRSTVAVAVTVGVLVKAALIGGVMVAVYRDPAYLILGVAVAQIDPLSFAAIGKRGDMSSRARTVLAAWAAFDDPVTVLLTVYAVGWLTGATGHLGGFAGDLAVNLLLAGVAWALWRFSRRLPAGRPRTTFEYALLATVTALAVWQVLMLGLALVALFLRPLPDRVLDLMSRTALQLAVFALGLLLVPGIDVGAGIVLGTAAYTAQIVVGSLVAARFPRRDRHDIALGQQSGITAVLLALLLEQTLPGTVAIVAPAIITVNVLHALAGALPRDRPVPAAPPGPPPPEPAPATPPRPPGRSSPVQPVVKPVSTSALTRADKETRAS
ncbi:hypothetical protein [Actinoplanes couchii]|uniref:hypothetical protein n=1 Tax=Actinoplanes couchii TaxID=403638 RepID=UPI0031E42315